MQTLISDASMLKSRILLIFVLLGLFNMKGFAQKKSLYYRFKNEKIKKKSLLTDFKISLPATFVYLIEQENEYLIYEINPSWIDYKSNDIDSFTNNSELELFSFLGLKPMERISKDNQLNNYLRTHNSDDVFNCCIDSHGIFLYDDSKRTISFYNLLLLLKNRFIITIGDLTGDYILTKKDEYLSYSKLERMRQRSKLNEAPLVPE